MLSRTCNEIYYFGAKRGQDYNIGTEQPRKTNEVLMFTSNYKYTEAAVFFILASKFFTVYGTVNI